MKTIISSTCLTSIWTHERAKSPSHFPHSSTCGRAHSCIKWITIYNVRWKKSRGSHVDLRYDLSNSIKCRRQAERDRGKLRRANKRVSAACSERERKRERKREKINGWRCAVQALNNKKKKKKERRYCSALFCISPFATLHAVCDVIAVLTSRM